MAKVWGLNIPDEYAQLFRDFFKLDWQGTQQRITKKKSTPGRVKSNWLAQFSRLPEYAQDWGALTEQQQNTFGADWGSNYQQAFALYTQQRWYREKNSLGQRTTADYFSHPIGHIHFDESDYALKLNFEVASGDYLLSSPDNIKKIQIPYQQTFEDLEELSFKIKIRPSEAMDNNSIWYLYTIEVYGDSTTSPKYQDESEEWASLTAGAELSLSAEEIQEYMDGEKVSKIKIQLQLYNNTGDYWIYDANINGIDSLLGAIRLNNSYFLADISTESSRYKNLINEQWGLTDQATGSYLEYQYPYSNGLDQADAGWYLTKIGNNSGIIDIDIATDSDGSNLIACVYSGRIYTSSDGGVNWTERRPAGDTDKMWKSVASDDDGSNLIACVYSGRLYTSSDSGANWTERRPAGDTDKIWQSVASDSDGSNLIACVYTDRLYTSSDGGVNWTERQPAGDTPKGWRAVASDDDGSNLIVAEYSGRLWTSSDGGANWTERRPAGDANKNWQSVASDDDGSNLIAAEWGGKIYQSTDGGVNWAEIKPVGGLAGRWNRVAITPDANRKYAATFDAKILIKL